ncbi:MAG: flagellar biosynthesis protein FlgB [Gallionella sp.]|jgi:flagellar basal-body rod protein FlgB|nr:flagellar biosynthesis protein FlgB [Gallionella sp.]
MSSIVDVLHFAVDGLTNQQQAIANNLANSQTPGYIAQNVNFQSSLAQALSSPGGGTATVTTTPSQAIPTTNGNNVSTSNQLVAAEQNTLQYQSTVDLLNAQFRLVQGSAGGSFA